MFICGVIVWTSTEEQSLLSGGYILNALHEQRLGGGSSVMISDRLCREKLRKPVAKFRN